MYSAELGGGHFGQDKTLLKISERFYWLGMVNDIKEYCAKHVKSVRKLIGKPVSCLCKLQTKGDIFIMNVLIFLAFFCGAASYSSQG